MVLGEGDKMKLYCVEFTNNNDTIIDVQHILANNNKEVHKRLDDFIEECKKYKLEDYHSYRFFEVNMVDGFRVVLTR
jgi:hypothetical protein